MKGARFWNVLKRIGRFFWPTPAGLWDLRARSLRLDGYTESQIVEYIGPRPNDDLAD